MGKMQKVKLTREEKKLKARSQRAAMKKEIREHPVLFAAYVILRALVLAVMVLQIWNREYYDVFLCALTLVLFLVPSFVERKLHIDVPNTLEVIILLFIFSAEILGEIQEYYLIFPFWDTMLHTLNGFLMAAIGIAMVDILNRSQKFKVRLSPVFVALVAFCFSMTIGVLWEFFEYGMDTFFHMDMQKDTWLNAFSTVSLHPEGKNSPVQVIVDTVEVNGQTWPDYLDIGLHDTMKDLLVNFIGAVVFSLIGMVYIMGRGKGKIAPRFIPRLKKEELAPPEEKAGLLEPIALEDEKPERSPAPAEQENCIFCRIARGEAPCRKIYEDEAVLAFLDIAQDAEGHTIVIPKKHCTSLLDCPDETYARLMETVKRISEYYVNQCGYEGVNVMNASGEAAQQSVPHLHFHIIPRKGGDGLNTWPQLPEDAETTDELWEKLKLDETE